MGNVGVLIYLCPLYDNAITMQIFTEFVGRPHLLCRKCNFIHRTSMFWWFMFII